MGQKASPGEIATHGDQHPIRNIHDSLSQNGQHQIAMHPVTMIQSIFLCTVMPNQWTGIHNGLQGPNVTTLEWNFLQWNQNRRNWLNMQDHEESKSRVSANHMCATCFQDGQPWKSIATKSSLGFGLTSRAGTLE